MGRKEQAKYYSLDMNDLPKTCALKSCRKRKFKTLLIFETKRGDRWLTFVCDINEHYTEILNLYKKHYELIFRGGI